MMHKVNVININQHRHFSFISLIFLIRQNLCGTATRTRTDTMSKYRSQLNSHISCSLKVSHNIQWPILDPATVPLPHKFCLIKPLSLDVALLDKRSCFPKVIMCSFFKCEQSLTLHVPVSHWVCARSAPASFLTPARARVAVTQAASMFLPPPGC